MTVSRSTTWVIPHAAAPTVLKVVASSSVVVDSDLVWQLQVDGNGAALKSKCHVRAALMTGILTGWL